MTTPAIQVRREDVEHLWPVSFELSVRTPVRQRQEAMAALAARFCGNILKYNTTFEDNFRVARIDGRMETAFASNLGGDRLPGRQDGGLLAEKSSLSDAGRLYETPR
jgi:hypothetical protein